MIIWAALLLQDPKEAPRTMAAMSVVFQEILCCPREEKRDCLPSLNVFRFQFSWRRSLALNVPSERSKQVKPAWFQSQLVVIYLKAAINMGLSSSCERSRGWGTNDLCDRSSRKPVISILILIKMGTARVCRWARLARRRRARVWQFLFQKNFSRSLFEGAKALRRDRNGRHEVSNGTERSQKGCDC